MFYIPWSGNGEELDRLLACIAQNKAAITEGSVPVLVDGYCTSQPSEAENLALAKTRSNRVKTEMILRGGLTEACFRTQNHADKGNFVTVRLVIPATPSEAELEARRRAAEQAEAERLPSPACQPAALGYPDTRPWRGMAHLPIVGHCRKRLVDFMDVERQGPPLCTLGSGSGSALLHG